MERYFQKVEVREESLQGIFIPLRRLLFLGR
jgi:hypothetical protein